MDYEINITPGMPPSKRHAFEDKFDVFLERYGGEVTGGGGMLDGSASDLTFEVESDLPIEVLQAYLEASSLSGRITVVALEKGEEVLQFETTSKPWWKFW
ncbi:MAG: hypothetical protein AAGI37_16955 [Planctomycetota bacterium]